MSLSDIPQMNNLFRLQFEPAQDAYVLLFPEGMIKLNPSAGEILSRVNGESSVTEIITSLMIKFPTAGDLTDDVTEFLRTAHDKKWVYYE